MKKLFILSTTLLFPIVANAIEAPKVTLGGRLDTLAASISSKKPFRHTDPSNPTNANQLNDFVIVNDTKLDINIDGKAVHDIKYGGLIRLNADASSASSSETSVGDKTMFYLEHDKVGRFEAGNTPGAGALFEMDILNFNRGTYGVEGYSMLFVEDKTMRFAAIGDAISSVDGIETRSIEFIESPNLPSNYSGYYYSDAPKVNFFTKPIEPITVGVTFIPDLDSTGSIAGVATKNGGPVFDAARAKRPATFRNILSGGIQFEKNISQSVGIKAMASGEIGKAKHTSIRNLKAYELGLMVTVNKDIKFGVTYGNWGKSFTVKNPSTGAKQKADYWTAGFGQQINKFGYAVTYMNSQKAGGLEVFNTLGLPLGAIGSNSITDYRSNKFANLVLDIDYELADGFKPYAGVSFYRFIESQGTKDNGSVVMLGTRLIF